VSGSQDDVRRGPLSSCRNCNLTGARYTPRMARRDTTPSRVYRDRDGRPTTDAAEAVSGEVVHYDVQGERTGRTRFFLHREDLPWLPVSEPAFLLWVLVGLIAIWAGIGLFLLN
jgi:hypothetical protein